MGNCFNPSLKCNNPNCKRSIRDHVLSFIHDDGRVNITVGWLPFDLASAVVASSGQCVVFGREKEVNRIESMRALERSIDGGWEMRHASSCSSKLGLSKGRRGGRAFSGSSFCFRVEPILVSRECKKSLSIVCHCHCIAIIVPVAAAIVVSVTSAIAVAITVCYYHCCYRCHFHYHPGFASLRGNVDMRTRRHDCGGGGGAELSHHIASHHPKIERYKAKEQPRPWPGCSRCYPRSSLSTRGGHPLLEDCEESLLFLPCSDGHCSFGMAISS